VVNLGKWKFPLFTLDTALIFLIFILERHRNGNPSLLTQGAITLRFLALVVHSAGSTLMRIGILKIHPQLVFKNATINLALYHSRTVREVLGEPSKLSTNYGLVGFCLVLFQKQTPMEWIFSLVVKLQKLDCSEPNWLME